jgi:hypothetical protein
MLKRNCTLSRVFRGKRNDTKVCKKSTHPLLTASCTSIRLYQSEFRKNPSTTSIWKLTPSTATRSAQCSLRGYIETKQTRSSDERSIELWRTMCPIAYQNRSQPKRRTYDRINSSYYANLSSERSFGRSG